MRAPGVISLLALCVGLASAQAAPPATPALFPHPAQSWYVAGQANYIYQAHGAFPAPYSGPNSLVNTPEDALSRVLTLYAGWQADPHFELLADVEETGGQGLSQVLGMAGFPNLDAVRNPALGTAPYLARGLAHIVIGLSKAEVTVAPSPVSSFTRLPRRRLEVWVGKMSVPDFFDANSVSGSSHQQFLNWTISTTGAYDYAADTRGYTWGAVAVYTTPLGSLRFAEALMPTVANGETLQWNLRRGHAENLEWDTQLSAGRWFGRHPLTARLWGFADSGNLGVYRQAVANYLAGTTPLPDITAHPLQLRRKPGVGFNLEQALTPSLSWFARAGWAGGRYESFAYTEAEQSLAAGAVLTGSAWRRPLDQTGVAVTVNGISGDHRRYLALGGRGFLLGDGGLRYGHERVAEAFYGVAVGRHGVYIGPDVQYAVNPGYNAARGPVWIPGARLHLDF